MPSPTRPAELPAPWDLNEAGELRIAGPTGYLEFGPSGIRWSARERSGEFRYGELESVVVTLPLYGRIVRGFVIAGVWLTATFGLVRDLEIVVDLGTRPGARSDGESLGFGHHKPRFRYQNCYAIECLMDVLRERKAFHVLGRPDVGRDLVIDAFQAMTDGDFGVRKRLRGVVDRYLSAAG